MLRRLHRAARCRTSHRWLLTAIMLFAAGPQRLAAGTTEVELTVARTTTWPGGFTGELRLRNADAISTIEGWLLTTGTQGISIDSVWNALVESQSATHLDVRNEAWNGSIGPGQTRTVGISGTGILDAATVTDCAVNSGDCSLAFVDETGQTPPPGGPAITLFELDGDGPAALEAIQSLGQTRSYSLSIPARPDATFEAISSHPGRVTVSVVDGATLRVEGLEPGRAGVRIRETGSTAERRLGIEISKRDGGVPGLPDYLAIGSVSEDTVPDLSFWWDLHPDRRNKRMDIRYIYLNGGPFIGWDTWTNVPGDRAARYIRESQRLGIIPFFVFYNVPEGGESYATNLANIQSESYLSAYYENLSLALRIIREEGGDDPVGIVLEPDFLGYIAQNANAPAEQVLAQTHTAYDTGTLVSGVDPSFPDNVKGFVESINYLIGRDAPNAIFGWQLNLWASPAGGFTTPIPGTGIVHLTDTLGIESGRLLIHQEASAITDYYLDAGVASHGADFLSIDKFGLDAGAEAGAAANPASSTWFWNNDHWQNYLIFVRAMHEASTLPIVLWQLPVGHINQSQAPSPYAPDGSFPSLDNTATHYEDSAGTFFLGDTFTAGGVRFDHFAANLGGDPKVTAAGDRVTWGSHMQDVVEAGVVAALFGAGVGISTDGVGSPPTDNYWWITRVQDYFANPVPLPGRVVFANGFETGDTSAWQ